METKKVIEQENEYSLILWRFDNVLKLCTSDTNHVYIEKSKATEVAKAIDPKYQELENRNKYLELFLKGDKAVSNLKEVKIKRLEDQNAKLLEALKESNKHLWDALNGESANFPMRSQYDLNNDLIQQSETK